MGRLIFWSIEKVWHFFSLIYALIILVFLPIYFWFCTIIVNFLWSSKTLSLPSSKSRIEIFECGNILIRLINTILLSLLLLGLRKKSLVEYLFVENSNSSYVVVCCSIINKTPLMNWNICRITGDIYFVEFEGWLSIVYKKTRKNSFKKKKKTKVKNIS